MLDGSNRTDRYSFEPTTGLGSTDYLGYGLFIDEGGNDQYTCRLVWTAHLIIARKGLFDLGNIDSYSFPQE